MANVQRFAPSEIEIDLPRGSFLCRLGAVQIARIQEVRGVKVTYPDQGIALVPKRIGTIVREHLAGVGGALPVLTVDSYFGDYDPQDSREVIVQGLIGGGRGLVDGEVIDVSEAYARRMVIEEVDDLPLDERWRIATTILVACTQGFTPPVDEDAPPGNVDAGPGTSSSTSPTPPET